MRRTMHYMVAMAAALWMALPQVKAQTVNLDFDPGIMYVKRNEGMHISFQEGNEWEITFTALDTLGNEYYSPVGMELKGGVYGDSTYVVLQTIDSILMYQPEPVMQAGVFVITEEYFPYIAQVDSNTTIHFYADVPLPLPAEGQKVVCNTFKEPLRLGFMGTVLEKRREGNVIVMVCDPTVERIRDFYQEFIYCGKGGETKEETEARERIERTHRMRRGVVVRAAEEEEPSIDDPDIELSIDINLFGKDLPFPSNAPDKTLEEITKKVTGKGEGKFDAGITLTGTAKGLLTIIADQKDEKVGIEVSLEGKLSGKASVSGSVQGAVPLRFGKAVSKKLPLNSEALLAAGFFLRGQAEVSISSSVECSATGYLALQYDEEQGWHIRTNGSSSMGDMAGLKGELSGMAAYTLGVLGKGQILNKKYDADIGLYLDGINLEGKITADLNSNIKEDSPKDLYTQYKTYSGGNHLVRSSQVAAEVSTKIKDKDRKLGGKIVIAQVEYNFAPEISGESVVAVDDLEQQNKVSVRVKNNGMSLWAADVELWIYDEDEKAWAKKVVLGKMGALDDSDFDFTANLELEKGHTYTFCPVYKPINTNMHISDKAISENWYVPYNVTMPEPELDKHRTVTLRATHEVAHIPGARAGFLYTDKMTDKGQIKEIEPSLEIDGTIEAEIDMPVTDFTVQAFVEVDGKRSYSELHKLKPLTDETPIILPTTDVTYNSATFNMRLCVGFDEYLNFLPEFEYTAEGDNTPQTIAVDTKNIKDGVASVKVEGLNVMTNYTVKAIVRYAGSTYESQKTDKFTTSSPIDNIEVTPSYTSAKFSAMVMEEYDVENVTVKLFLAKDKKLNNPMEIQTELEEEFEGIVATCDVEDLEMDETYYYKIEVRKLAEKEVYYSDVLQFNTLNGLSATISKPIVKSTSATLRGKTTDYVLNAIKEGKAYSGRFYFSKSKSSVTNRKSDYVDVTITKADITAEIEGLTSETKYYCMLALELDGENVNNSEIISFTTPDPYDVTTLDAVVEDATVTLAGELTLEAYDEIKSDQYNTIYAGFEYALTKEALMSDTKEGVTRLLEVSLEKSETDALFHHTLEFDPGSLYYYRAFIYVDGKDYPANIKTFQTLEYDGDLIPLAKKK
ncbi:MAG: hypothetical protein IKL03_04285 [Bacteroidaceae bacterium]|nr:hypothetical protein [Bacteroidaceae bacterium]